MVLGTTYTSLPIKIAQINSQRKKTVITQLLNNFGNDFDILLIQEPSWGFIGNDPDNGEEIYGPVALQGWNTILPVPAEAGSRTRPRTLTYFKPRHDYAITLRSDILEDRDVQILDINQANHDTVTVINIYNDTPKGVNCILNRLQHTDNVIRNNPTAITGDFNMHHPLWSREDREANHDQVTEDTVDWLAQGGLSLMNTKGEITHLARHGGERPSVIDLTFTNQEANAQDTFKDWAVDPQLSLDSDHNAIKFTIDQGREEIDNPCGTKFNLKDVQIDEWTKVFEEEIGARNERMEELRNIDHPEHNHLDEYASLLTESLQTAMERLSKAKKKSHHAKPWWDNDLKAAVDAVSAARQEHQGHQRLLGEFSPQLQANVRRCRNFFKRLCKYKKRAWVNKTLEEASADDIWSFPNWSKGIRNYPTPPISQGPNLPKATTHYGKCEALRKELYQPPQSSTYNRLTLKQGRQTTYPLKSLRLKKSKKPSTKTAPTRRLGTLK
jgi:Endonuclease-reverse transcriptase